MALRLFADDAVIYCSILSEKDCELRQQDLVDLNIIRKTEWGMKLRKCNLLRVTMRKKPITTTYRIREHQLEEVETAKYLGVILSKDLSWNAQVKMVTCKANHTLPLLQRNVSGWPKSLKELSYKALVRPQGEYCSSIWDPHHKNHAQQI